MSDIQEKFPTNENKPSFLQWQQNSKKLFEESPASSNSRKEQ